MSLVLSILAIFVSLVAVFLAADSKQTIDGKIRDNADVYTNSANKIFDECVKSIKYLTQRVEVLETEIEKNPGFKSEILDELASVNKQLSDLRHHFLMQNARLSKTQMPTDPEPVSEPQPVSSFEE